MNNTFLNRPPDWIRNTFVVGSFQFFSPIYRKVIMKLFDDSDLT